MAYFKGTEKARYVSRMFAEIAPKYDLLNSIMTGGLHHRWRNKVTDLVTEGLEGPSLDVASGTGDFAFALSRHANSGQVVGVDYVREMVDLAYVKSTRKRNQESAQKLSLAVADALNLPFKSDQFSCVTIGFGLRNLGNVEHGLAELHRVIKPGGKLAVLEMTQVPGPLIWRWLFRWYFRNVTPVLGAVFAGNWKAYSYLPQSVDWFPPAEELKAMMAHAGFRQITYRYFGMRTVALHIGVA